MNERRTVSRLLKDAQELKQIAAQLRIDVVSMLLEAGSGHSGGSLSAVEIMSVLYFHEMNHDPADPQWPERDRFILSKGHVCPILYAALARAGYFPVEELLTLRRLGSRLQGHPGRNKGLPGLEASTGSLGQGLGIAVGIALGAKHDAGYRVYCLNGDGELDEGSIWEAAMAAGHYRLDNLVTVVDNNNLQIDGRLKNVMDVYPIDRKFEAFNWSVIPCDGHDAAALINAFEQARDFKGKPSVIIAKTVKGKGVSFMENEAGWHGKAPNPEEARKALKELKKQQVKVGVWPGAQVQLKPSKLGV
jgi:transketolase